MADGDRIGHERRLRAAVLQGDEAAWQSWYDAASSGLRAYVHWRCPGLPELADDLVQETWLTAIRRVRAFRPDAAPFAAWLRGIAANLIRNRLRKRRDYPSRECCEKTEVQNGAGAERASELVAYVLAELPSAYEEVLRAKYLDGLTVQAIADRSGGSAKAVESLLTRARQAFREAYQAAEQTDG